MRGGRWEMGDGRWEEKMERRTAAGDASATDAATTAMIAESFMMFREYDASAERMIEQGIPKATIDAKRVPKSYYDRPKNPTRMGRSK